MANPQAIPADLVSLIEAARSLGISQATLRRSYVEKGKLQVIPTPTGQRVRMTEVEQLAAMRQERADALAALPAGLLTAAQVCDRLGLSRPMLHRWTKLGKLHPVRVPNHKVHYFALDEVHQLKAQRQHRIDAAQALPDDVYTAAQVCQMLGIKAKTLGVWRFKGKVQGRWLPDRPSAVYDKPPIDALVQAKQAQPIVLKTAPDPAAVAALYARTWELTDDGRPDQQCKLVRYLCLHYPVTSADAEDAVSQVFQTLLEEGGAFFTQFATLDEQYYGLYLRCRSQILVQLKTQRVRGTEAHQWALHWQRPRVLQVEEQVIAREQCQAVLAQAQQYPTNRRRILEMIGQEFTETEIVAVLQDEGLAGTRDTLRRYRKQVITDARRLLQSWQDTDVSPSCD